MTCPSLTALACYRPDDDPAHLALPFFILDGRRYLLRQRRGPGHHGGLLMGFQVGDRVIVRAANEYDTGTYRARLAGEEPMAGHYGHVAYVMATCDSVGVKIEGRVGAPVNPDVLAQPKPWPFYPDELEHAD